MLGCESCSSRCSSVKPGAAGNAAAPRCPGLPLALCRSSPAGSGGTSTWCARRSCRARAARRSAGRSAAAAGLHEAAGVDAAVADRVARGGAQMAAQEVELLGAQLSRDPARGEAGAPERLVGEQVADAGDRALVEQPGLERDVPLPTRARNMSRLTSAASGPTCEKSGSITPARAGACRAARAARRRRSRARTGPSGSGRAPRRPRSAPPSRGAARGPGRRRRSPPTGTSRAGAPRVSRRPTSAAAISPGACGRQT